MNHALRFARVSAAEIARRHGLLADLCALHRLGAIVTLGNEDDMSGYVRWFTDEPVSSYRTAVAYLPGEGMSVVEHGSRGGRSDHDPADESYRGVFEIHTVASFQSAAFTSDCEAVSLASALRRHGLRRIGIAGLQQMPHAFVQALGRELDGPAFIDVTDAVDAMMVVKSAEELDLIRAAAELQDQVFAEVLRHLRPGMREIDVTAIARAASLRLGGAGGVILAGSAPQGSFAPFNSPFNQARVIGEGDYVSLLIENAGPAGYFTEIARNISFGKAQQCLIDASGTALDLRNRILPEIVAGASCPEIFARHNAQRATFGLEAENRVFAHGQGYFLVERPIIRDDEPMVLAANMNLAVHPTLADGTTTFAVVCDNFLLDETGKARRIHKTEERVFEV